jgi:hypothetical protein
MKMMKKLSKKEAIIMSIFEPIDGEFRARAHKKWRCQKESINMFGPRRRHKKLDVENLSSHKIGFVGIEDMEMMVIDYFPLDELA